jgi:hypothetical protein
MLAQVWDDVAPEIGRRRVSVKEDDRSTGADFNKANLAVENFDPTPRMRIKRTDFNILHAQNSHRPLTTMCQETSRVGRNKLCRTLAGSQSRFATN